MENITSRSCNYQEDHERLMDFWLNYRAVSDVRAYPTIWRIRLLLTSRVWNQEKGAQIWENESGQIIGFAMLWSRQPASSYIVLDSFVHPKYASDEILSAILNWGDIRANEITKEQGTALKVYVTGFSQYAFSDSILKQRGYARPSLNSDEHNVYFAKSLQKEIPSPIVPAGYEIRELQGADDLETYRALYGFAEVNPLHQKELIESKEYCHLVMVDPDGELIAYCECSVCYAEWERTDQRIGWIDYVATKPEQQKRGFGQAVLTAGLSHLKALGAATAMLITVNTNTPAVALYNKAGFESVEVKEYPSYQKQISFSRKNEQTTK